MKEENFIVAVKLLREDGKIVCGDSAYLGLQSWDEVKQNPNLSTIECRINRWPGRLPKVSDNAIDWERYTEYRKSSVCCKVDHPYRNRKEHPRVPKDHLPGPVEESQTVTCVVYQCESV